MSTLKGKAHWHLCPWVLGGRIKKKKNSAEEKPWGNRITKIQYWDGGGQRSCEKDQECCKQFSFSYQSSTSLPLLHWLSCFWNEDAGKVILSQQGYWSLKAITQSLLAMVNDRYTLINVIRMTMKGSLLTFQRCCSDVSKSTWNNRQKESAQHRTYRWYLWRFAAGQDRGETSTTPFILVTSADRDKIIGATLHMKTTTTTKKWGIKKLGDSSLCHI